MESPTNAASLDRRLCFALGLAVALCRVAHWRSFPIYDDAFITFRYAENLAAGEGLVYNPGATWEPVLGTTTPLYAVLMGGLATLGLPVVWAALVFNALCDAVTGSLLAGSLAARPIAAVASVVAFAALPHLGRISAGGMEPPLFVALSLGAAVAASRGRLGVAGWLGAFACATRPEGVLLIASIAAFHVRSWRSAWSFFVPVALVGAACTAVLTAVYGSPIAQSVRAKAGRHGLGLDWVRAWSTLAQAFAPSMVLLVLAPLTTLGAALAFRRTSALRAFALFAIAIPLAYIASGAKTWGWYFYAPLTLACAALALGADALGGALAKRAWRAMGERTPALTALGALIAIAASVAFAALVPERITERVYRPLEREFERLELRARGERLLASDIGAAGYFSGATILDSEGLVWPAAREYVDQGAALAAEEPEYFMIVANLRRMRAFLAHPIHARYTPIARFNARGETRLDPPSDSLVDGWAQDYILYRRSDLDAR